jgi:Flp pilus assembly protein TadD
MYRNALIAFIFIATTCSLCACSSAYREDSSAKKSYRTIPVQIGRNTDEAKQLTAEAATALHEGDAGRAEQLLQEALTADIMHGPAHNNLGQLYYQQKRYYEAALEFQYAIRLMPYQPIPRNNLGLVFEAVGRIDEAAEQYALAVAEEPDNPVMLGNLARARIRDGETGPEVRDLLRQIVMKDTRPEWREWAERQLHLLPEK